ncbi:probable serine/threonine-protein kinase DDB_G0282963 isoform X1 [Octopus sinensis]|uniref:Probable serine/threonine-protein kinase DDB_G0282963 isoform X1 n=1 Tax=Octopus sinensis TaxID=2607531 RepID=A0A6P7SYG0_9MOLL|nr:probable serine/threonine-protein kinase DDB_G0282963 isoform X1 [Octopus sinensis]XP_029643453.1 probable serine/threonine-protein kinase DDB_G0282963 isoform X1 [Octopus sinensis]XP_029643459.1 probable serine/threonine-protein kinase DDB_G0282963 isoform X1 [Octopus sinensis]
MHAVMYNHLTNSCSNSVVDSTNQCHIKIKTEDDKDLGSCNFSPNYKNSSKLLLNGSNSNVDFTMSAKGGGNQTFSTSQESKSCFKESSDVSNQKNFLLDKVLGHSVENLMKFAEILYKCTLCTTLPSILTSRDSFISHVNDQHLTKKQSYKDCQHCNFNFSTEEDLRAHCRFSHGIETSDTELDSPEASPIDEFTNKSGTEISTENQCTISDPNKTMQYRTSRFVMDTVHGKQRQLAPSAPLFGQVNGNSVASSSSSTGTNISVNNNSSNGCANSNSNNKISVNSVKDSVKPEKMTMEENITRLQQLADQILISNTRLHAGGNSSGFHSAMSNPSYTHDFGKYTKLIREGGNIVYFCQVCNCKCQARAAFLSHCSSYQHRARVETADRSVSSDQQIQHHHQSQQQQHKQQLTTLPPLPTHSQSLPHPIPPQTNIHSSHQNIQSHHQKQHQQQKQPQQPQQKLSPNFKRESSHCPSNSNGNYVSTKKVSSYSSMPSSLTSSSSSSAYSPTSLLEDSSNNDTNNATTSSSHNSNNCKTDSDDNSVTQPSTQPNSRSHATNIPLGGERLSPVSSDTPKEVSDNELDKETKSQEVTSDGEPNSDRESAPRQRRKRHAPVAVRHQPQLTTSWSDSDSDEEFNSSKNNKKTADNMSLTAGENSSLEKLSCKSKEDKNQVHASSSDQTVNEQSKDFPPLKKTKDTSDRSFTNKQSSSSNNQDVLENQTQFSSMEQTFPQAVDSLGMLSSVVESLLIHPNQSMSTSQSLEKVLGTTIKTEPEDQSENDIGLKGIYRCSFCDFVCYDIRDYEEHFIREHDSDLLDANITDSSGKSVHGEYWKMLKIKEVLPELLVGCAKGYVSRDLLLQKISMLLNIPEMVHWGPACNKAVREEFPSSMAQRKGKFKKTYYFGVALIEQLQEQEELSDSENVTYQPLRDLSQDLEKILQFLPELVFWTGDFDMGISRDEVLQLLGQKIEEPGVQYWGVQCNRAMRFLFPSIHMKRKGKFKTTVYFGVDFMKNFTRQIPHTFESDQMMFIKSEPIDDSYEDSSTSHLQGMTLSIFPTSTSSVANPNSQTTSTAMSMDFTTSETNP